MTPTSLAAAVAQAKLLKMTSVFLKEENKMVYYTLYLS